MFSVQCHTCSGKVVAGSLVSIQGHVSEAQALSYWHAFSAPVDPCTLWCRSELRTRGASTAHLTMAWHAR